MTTVCASMANRSDIPAAPEPERISEEEKAALFADFLEKKAEADRLERAFWLAHKRAEQAYTKHFYAAARNVRLNFKE